jgi:hypothetical protein
MLSCTAKKYCYGKEAPQTKTVSILKSFFLAKKHTKYIHENLISDYGREIIKLGYHSMDFFLMLYKH